MGQLEKHLEARCNAWASERGWEHAKLERVARGWPDDIYFGPCGLIAIVEFKLPGEKPRPQQAAIHRRLGALGHPVSVVTEFEIFQTLLRTTESLAGRPED